MWYREFVVSNNQDKFHDENASGGNTAGSCDPAAPQATVPDPGRRRFSRNALAGGAVLASLGNRPAWGQTVVGCMSVTTIASFNPTTGMFMSAPGGRPEHNEALAAEIHHIHGPYDGDYINATGTGTDAEAYSTCQEVGDLDGVCLVEGSECP